MCCFVFLFYMFYTPVKTTLKFVIESTCIHFFFFYTAGTRLASKSGWTHHIITPVEVMRMRITHPADGCFARARFSVTDQDVPIIIVTTAIQVGVFGGAIPFWVSWGAVQFSSFFSVLRFVNSITITITITSKLQPKAPGSSLISGGPRSGPLNANTHLNS